MYALGIRHTGRDQSRQCQRVLLGLYRLVLQFGTEHQFADVDIVVVILQLVEDVER